MVGCLLGWLGNRSAAEVQVARKARGFVQVQGRRFLVEGRPFYFVGTNLNVMHGKKTRRLAAQTIAAAAADGLSVGRVWALGEGLASASESLGRDYLFRRGPDGWHEEAFLQLDRVVAEAGVRGLRLVITLSNHWKDYGGIPMYLRWAGHVDSRSYGYTDRFFTDAKVRGWFLEHVRRVVTRVNSVTGVAYRDDPTIMAWELQNEMNGTPEAASARRQWVREVARRIRSWDAKHLIVPGVIGYGLQLERNDWIEMCRLRQVSYCDHHFYPEELLDGHGVRLLRPLIDDRVQLAHYVVGKPVVFGEFGFADRPPIRRRVARHRAFLRNTFADAANGAMVWIYQPTLHWHRRYGILVDDRSYLPLRRALGRIGRRVSKRPPRLRNPRLGPSRGTAPLAPTHWDSPGLRRPHRQWRIQQSGWSRLLVPVDQFAHSRFEQSGTWDGGILVHAYGRRTGWIDYLFAGPRFVPTRLHFRLRLSSEYPGSVAPRQGISRVSVLLDGRLLAQLTVRPDDGVGRWYSVAVADDATLAGMSGGRHRLRLRVDPGPHAQGVAIYGREAPLNRQPVERPGPLAIWAGRVSIK